MTESPHRSEQNRRAPDRQPSDVERPMSKVNRDEARRQSEILAGSPDDHAVMLWMENVTGAEIGWERLPRLTWLGIDFTRSRIQAIAHGTGLHPAWSSAPE